MINIPPVKQSEAVKIELITQISKTWKVGQILNATTEQGGGALSKVLIRVGQYTLEAKTPIALNNDQPVKLLVKALPDKQTAQLPRLSILPFSDPPSINMASLATMKLRQFIAVQQSFTQIQLLAKLLVENKLSSTLLGKSLNNQLSLLQSSLNLRAQGMSSSQLKQLVLNSGVFFESRLLSQSISSSNSASPLSSTRSSTLPPTLGHDFKYQLFSISTRLAQLTGVADGAQKTEQTLSPARLKELQGIVKSTATGVLSGVLSASNLSRQISEAINSLSRPALIELSRLLSGSITNTPLTNISGFESSDELVFLSKALLSAAQLHPQSQQLLLEQLRFRIMLLDFTQQLDQSIAKLTSLQLQPLSREADNMVLLLFNLIFKDSNEKFDVHFRIHQQSKDADESKQSWQVFISFNFKTLGKVQSSIHL
ncbi:hypothetical protein MNBD_GAMMA08-434, partial [hydrothermal vent metagenome]